MNVDNFIIIKQQVALAAPLAFALLSLTETTNTAHGGSRGSHTSIKVQENEGKSVERGGSTSSIL